MTDQDNLRDRIADLLWRTDEKSWEDQAQAIIDEFGLTKEWQPVSRQILNDGTAIENPTQSRIVGKWEPECRR